MNADRLRSVLSALLDELLPRRRFYAPVRYRVSKAEGGKFSAKPENKSGGFPDIVDAPIRGVPGGNPASKLKSGTSILVSFVEGDPGDPFLAWIDESVSPDELALAAQTKAKITAPAVEVHASGSLTETVGAYSVNASGAANIVAGGDAKLEATGTAKVKGATVELGTAPTGIPTQQTLTPLLALIVAERVTLQAFLNGPLLALSGGTAAPYSAAALATDAALALPTNFSQTVKAGA